MSREAAWAFPSRATPNLSTQGPFGTGTGVRGLTHGEFHLWADPWATWATTVRPQRSPFKGGVWYWNSSFSRQTPGTWQHLACRNPSGSGSLVAKPPATTGWKSAMHGSSVRRRGWRERWDPFWGPFTCPKHVGICLYGILFTQKLQMLGLLFTQSSQSS